MQTRGSLALRRQSLDERAHFTLLPELAVHTAGMPPVVQTFALMDVPA